MGANVYVIGFKQLADQDGQLVVEMYDIGWVSADHLELLLETVAEQEIEGFVDFKHNPDLKRLAKLVSSGEALSGQRYANKLWVVLPEEPAEV